MKKHSLLYLMMRTLVVLIILQVILMVVLIFAFGIIKAQYNSSYSNINFIVDKKANEVERIFNDISKNLVVFGEQLNSHITKEIKTNQISISNIGQETAFAEQIFLDKAVEMTDFLYANPNASGVFVILNSQPLSDGSYPCLYIRKRTAETNLYSDSNYWVLKFGSTKVAEKLNIQLDYMWEYNFHAPKSKNDFFNRPFSRSSLNQDGVHDYYISRPFKLDDSDKYIITETIPLTDDMGNPYGVFGVETSLDSIAKTLNIPQLPNVENGFYSLTDNDSNDFTNAYVNSTPFSQVFLNQENLLVSMGDKKYSVYNYYNANAQYKDVVGTFKEIVLYNSTSPYADESYYLYGFIPRSELLKDAFAVRNVMIGFSIIFAFTSIIFAVIATFYTTKPILRLSEEVSQSDADKGAKFSHTGIAEMDRLSEALEKYSINVIHSASRLSTIIDMLEKPIGAFEINYIEKRVYISESLFRIFDMPFEKKSYVTLEQWDEFNKKYFGHLFQNDIYAYDDEGFRKYVQRTSKKVNNNVFGVIMDVTEDVYAKQRLEYERDMDGLTSLLNRKAFLRSVEAQLNQNPNTLAAVLFCDIDNLKYINDNYGHDFGDRYIMLMAECLDDFRKYENCIAARMSGDEFAVFVQTGGTKDDIRKIFDDVFNDSKNRVIIASDGSYVKLRCSRGVAWYPDDAKDISQLIKYSDFAMYEIKHANKGSIREFDLKSYNRSSFLQTKSEILNSFIENELLYFAYQPIVDAKTGEIFAYEAFMRSHHRDLTSPKQILQIAGVQSKLYAVEKLVFFTSLEYVELNSERFGNKKLFINSIPSIIFASVEVDMIKKFDYDSVLSKIVVEVCEDSQVPQISEKSAQIKELGMEIAVDNNEVNFVSDFFLINPPNYLKIDSGIVRNIDTDSHKQQHLRNVIKYAMENKIKTIAQGIETTDELKTLCELGVDYLQGYYLYRAKPQIAIDDDNVVELIKSIQ